MFMPHLMVFISAPLGPTSFPTSTKLKHLHRRSNDHTLELSCVRFASFHPSFVLHSRARQLPAGSDFIPFMIKIRVATEENVLQPRKNIFFRAPL
ncbi:hypothetical protein B0H13DRAFT_1177184 [Mycena leptocephala]|nr:hypothetical protein B0H13DRAFT_1177184 [Mycena leptocephala]